MNTEQTKHNPTKNRTVLFVAIGAALLVIVTVVILSLLAKPTRSVAAFCSTYKEQNATLAKSRGNTYSVRPFTRSSISPHDFVIALDKLESTAPQEIEPVSGSPYNGHLVSTVETVQYS